MFATVNSYHVTLGLAEEGLHIRPVPWIFDLELAPLDVDHNGVKVSSFRSVA